MLKKILTLSLVAVILSVTAFANPYGIDAQAEVGDAAVTTVVTDAPEMIGVASASGSVTLTNIDEDADEKFAMNTAKWIYMKYDISGFKSLEEIKSAVLTLGINFGTKSSVSVRLLDEATWNKAVTAINSGTANAEDFTAPTGDSVASMERAGGNSSLKVDMPYHFTDYAYNYYDDKTTSSGFSEWKAVNMHKGTFFTTVSTAIENNQDYLYLSIASSNTSNSVTVGREECKITASSGVQVVYNSVYKDATYAPIYYWPSSKGAFGNLKEDFTYNVVVSPTGTKVRLLCGIYEGDALLGVVTNDVLTVGTDATSLSVPLSSYPTATKVKCFLWDGETLAPYTETPLENGAYEAVTAE